MNPDVRGGSQPAMLTLTGEGKVIAGSGLQPVASIPRRAPERPGHAGRRPRRRVILTAIVVIAAVAAANEVWRVSRPVTTVHYVTAPVTRGPVTRAVTASGSVNPVTTIQVGTYVSGVIQQLYCDYNTQVRRGQLCAKIDPRPYQTLVDQGRANLSTAEAQLAKDQTVLTYAKLTYQRNVELSARGLVTQDAVDAARSASDAAQAQIDLDRSVIEQRKAALEAASINLEYTNIVSPVQGTVVSRNVTMGQTVAASFQTPTLFLIATDLTKMQVDANVSESDIGGIRVGNAVTFTVEAFPSHIFQGQVMQVRQAPQTVQNVVTYDVVVSVPNQELLLKPGMTATARIVVDQRQNVLRIPDRALRYTPGGLAGVSRTDGVTAVHGRSGPATQVWVLRDGRPTAVPLTAGLDDDTFAEVVRGEVQEGDGVITSEQTSTSSTPARLPSFRF
jgi:HlyD family secretion protein